MESEDSRPLLPPSRPDGWLTARDRVYALLEAVVAVSSSLELEVLLHGIIDTAVSLVNASYGVIGLVGEGGKLAEFIPVSTATRAGGAQQDPVSFLGAPAPMHNTFLGVPIRIRGEVYGNLYLSGKLGGGSFDAEDEAALIAFAAAAGVAIENARLYEEARRQQRWLSATAEVTRHLLSGAEPDDAIALITEKALDITAADLVMVTLPMDDGQHQRIEHAVGDGAQELLGLIVPMQDAVTALVVGKADRLTIPDYGSHEQPEGRLHLGPMVVVPLGRPGHVQGVLSAGRRHGSPPLPQATADLLATFAAQATIALELAEHRRQAEQMAVCEDRDRIARDLHDLVIQRLYATGMSLQRAMPSIGKAEVADRVSGAVDALDDTIGEIRSAIFALHAHADAKHVSLRSRIVGTVKEMAPALGFAPSMRLDGSLDTAVPAEVGEHLLTAIREALANVARHACASRVDLSVVVTSQVLLTVTDDGVGIGGDGRRSGLGNLEERAADLGGALVVGQGSAGGTTLTWQVPVSQKPRAAAPRISAPAAEPHRPPAQRR